MFVTCEILSIPTSPTHKLIPRRELFGSIKVGDKINARVTSIKSDGKIDLSVREKAYIQIEKDAESGVLVVAIILSLESL